MSKILVTGGTIFVSRTVAEYFAGKGNEVFVLNRGNYEQSEGITLIKADRLNLGDVIKKSHFDVVLDVNAYTRDDIKLLLDNIGGFDNYVMISSSAVYPEYLEKPFREEFSVGPNKYWGKYGTDKIEAEEELKSRVENAYILRPPYLYGAMNNVYREAFVFDCAINNRKFYLPKDGEMKLQFFLVKDMCRMIEKLLQDKPEQKIYNVGNEKTVTIKEWVKACYKVVGKEPVFVNVTKDIEQRSYFSFYDYEYQLDITKQKEILEETTPLEEGLKEAYEWYKQNMDKVNRKDFIAYIDEKLAGESME